MKPKGRGRPPMPEEDRRTVRFEVRLTPAEVEDVKRAAEGKTSTWARNVILKAAKRKA